VCSNEEPRNQVDRLTGGRTRVTKVASCDCVAADAPNAEVNPIAVEATAQDGPVAGRRIAGQPMSGWRIARRVTRDYRG
jgi:hypothetical protein